MPTRAQTNAGGRGFMNVTSRPRRAAKPRVGPILKRGPGFRPMTSSQLRRFQYFLGLSEGRKVRATGSSYQRLTIAQLSRPMALGPASRGGVLSVAQRAGMRRGITGAPNLGIRRDLFKPPSGPSGPNVGSFHSRAGQYVKNKQGRFIGSR